MDDLINPNIRSIIHILNNWNFTYDGSHVKANLEIYITKEELEFTKSNFQNILMDLQRKDQKDDNEIQKYAQAIFDLDFAINELQNSMVR